MVHGYASTVLPLSEQPLWPLLDEHDNEYEHADFREHRARPGFEELVDAESHRRVHGSRQLADTAEHDHHERVDDVTLAEIGTDVANLRKRASREAGKTRAKAERPHVDAPGRNAGATRHGAVLRHGAHEQPEARAREQQPDQHEHGTRKADDDDPAPGQYNTRDRFDAARHPRRIFDGNVLRTENRAHGLHQDQADTPGREQRFKRAA